MAKVNHVYVALAVGTALLVVGVCFSAYTHTTRLRKFEARCESAGGRMLTLENDVLVCVATGAFR